MSEIEFRPGLVICKHCFQFWSSLRETATVSSTVCKRWPSWIPECRLTLSKHGVWPACCSLASMHYSFPASDTPALEKQNARAPWGQYFRVVGMLAPHSQECSTYPIISDITAVTIYAPAVRKEKESLFLLRCLTGRCMALEIAKLSSSPCLSPSSSLSHAFLLLSPPLFSFCVIVCFPLVSFCFSVWNKIKGKSTKLTNMLFILVLREEAMSLITHSICWRW